MSQELFLNGIDASTGGPLDDFPVTTGLVAEVARGHRIAPEELKDARIRAMLDAQRESHFGVAEGIDSCDLAETGWGIIFPADLPEKEVAAINGALQSLLDLRRSQSSAKDARFFKRFTGHEFGYRPGETKNDFLKRLGRGPGAADPAAGIPYYLLIVGSPEMIPFSFQYQLDVQYAVGRIDFEELEDYCRYAKGVVEAETTLRRGKDAVFFGVSNPGDKATQMSENRLIRPLATRTTESHPDWNVKLIEPGDATKSNLTSLMGGSETPALVVSASHGMKFKLDDPRLPGHTGALLCQDWPGPGAAGPVDERYYFSADDISVDANVSGMFAILFACYSGGIPQADNFYRQAFGLQKPIAPRAFISALPRKLLSHQRGAALGVFAHVERAWGSSIAWDGTVGDIETFHSAVDALLDGKPAGVATEYFNQRYAEISTMLTEELDSTTAEHQDDVKLAGLWTANNDARNYILIGDPAVHLSPRGADAPKE